MVPTQIPAQVAAKEGIAALPGTHLGYWDTGGSGTPIVLLHPATGTARIWSYQQPVFAEAGYRVIAYSRRGYADSDPVPRDSPGSASADLHNLMEFLGVNRFHLAGSAAGGSVAVDYALSHPDRLLSLTLACAVLGDIDERDYAAMSGRIRAKGFDDMAAEFRELSPAYRALNPAGTAQWAALERAAVTGNRVGQRPANTLNWAALESIKTPVLVLGGDADLYAPAPLLRAYAAHLPDSEIAILPEGGHSLYWELPEVFNRTLLQFFARHSA